MRAFGTGLPCSSSTRMRTVPPGFIRKLTGPIPGSMLSSFMSVARPEADATRWTGFGSQPTIR